MEILRRAVDIRFVNRQQQSVLQALPNKFLVQRGIPDDTGFIKGFEAFQVEVTREREARLLRR